MNQTILSMDTPSKINVFLSIKNKMANGYHELETIFLPLHDIADKISIEFDFIPSGINIYSSSSSIPLNQDNLCYKAASLFEIESGINSSWNIIIKKNIPIAAGMGGGSSDAAAVLLLLQKYYNNILSEKQLHSIALKLGADVPYFLNPVPALGKGVGEKLEQIALTPGLYAVILAPLFPVSAAWAYENYIPVQNRPNSTKIIEYLKAGAWKELGPQLYNDLATALYKKFPALTIFKENLIEAGAINAEVTGSGPTLYAIVDDKQKTEEIVNKIKKAYNKSILCTYSRCL